MGLLYIFATCSSGVLIAQFMNTQHAATIVTFMLFSITPFYLSDMFFPVCSMPTWLQWLSAIQPATHFTAIARGILLKGVGWSILWPRALAILAAGIATSVLAFARFRKRLV
jgi:ABC-2 type transport system permease protein